MGFAFCTILSRDARFRCPFTLRSGKAHSATSISVFSQILTRFGERPVSPENVIDLFSSSLTAMLSGLWFTGTVVMVNPKSLIESLTSLFTVSLYDFGVIHG